ncbi:hypothetical protein [Achromobacter pestifer]
MGAGCFRGQARGKQPRGTNASDPRIRTWIEADVTGLQLLDAYTQAALDREATGDPGPITPGFLDIFVAKVLKPPQATSALNGKRAAASSSDPLAWATTWAGIVAKGAELGITQKPGELEPYFKARIMDAARLTDDDRARLRADFGVHA